MEKFKKIFEEYEKGTAFKSSLGSKGLYEQSRINERFYIGDQWYGAKCGNDRPLVRHNIIRRIGDYKMSSLTGTQFNVVYTAVGSAMTAQRHKELKAVRKDFAQGALTNPSTLERDEEIALITNALSLHAKSVADRLGFSAVIGQALRNAFISGTGIIYTYWDTDAHTGLHTVNANIEVRGELKCRCLRVENVCFGDPYTDSVEAQPYIIISSKMSVEEACFRAAAFGAGEFTLSQIRDATLNGKVTVLTKLYKKRMSDGMHVMAQQVCSKAVIRDEWDTLLHRYPITKFSWDTRGELIYGESEITYLIPNQIAINRMITASVWAGMTMGMPIMVVNGDTVPGQITNDPGQVIKIYGSNEDVQGAVRYVSPPAFAEKFQGSVDALIQNTLNQCGANEAALGDMKADNATAIQRLNSTAVKPMEMMRARYFAFLEELALIWADFWISRYGNRSLSIEDENGVWYLPFSASRYKNLTLLAKVNKVQENSEERLSILKHLFDKGNISAKTYVESLPEDIIGDKRTLLYGIKEDENEGD